MMIGLSGSFDIGMAFGELLAFVKCHHSKTIRLGFYLLQSSQHAPDPPRLWLSAVVFVRRAGILCLLTIAFDLAVRVGASPKPSH